MIASTESRNVKKMLSLHSSNSQATAAPSLGIFGN